MPNVPLGIEQQYRLKFLESISGPSHFHRSLDEAAKGEALPWAPDEWNGAGQWQGGR